MNTQALLRLLQLVSPALPVGAYSYSEGLETLVQSGSIVDRPTLEHWLIQELRYGTIRLEATAVMRVHAAVQSSDYPALSYWNQWLSALRETEELREQSWQMGRSLTRLLQQVQPEVKPFLESAGEPCNFAVAFAIAAAHWEINQETTAIGYLQSWVSNLVNAGIRLIPLGQTQGQQVLLQLYPHIEKTIESIQSLTEDEFWSWSWSLTIASMTHETLYSRLFRS